MRRFLTAPWIYLVGLYRSTVEGWNQFFFTPVDPTSLGLIRLGTGALMLWSMALAGLDLHDYFGSRGWASSELIQQRLAIQVPYAWSFWFYVPDSLLLPVWLGCLLILVLYTVGAFSRVTSVMAWVIAVSTCRRIPFLLYGFDQVAPTWALYLAVSGASGHAVSLDRLIERFKLSRAEAARKRKLGRMVLASGTPVPSVGANIGLRLIQIHISIIYGMAGLAKLRGEPWWDGTAGWGLLAAGEFRLFDLTWLAAYPGLIAFGTHLALFLEVTYPTLIWIPKLRPLILALVILMHLAIGLTVGLAEFSLAMIVGNFAFVSGSWLRSLVVGMSPTPSVQVLYDGACPRCRFSMAIITAGDPAKTIEPIDLTAVEVTSIHPSLTNEACLKAMHAVRTSDTKVFAGFDAVVQVAWCTPLFWPLAIAGEIPGVKHVGRWVYQKVADSRPRDQVCNDEVCSLPLHAPSKAVTGRSSDESERPSPVGR